MPNIAVPIAEGWAWEPENSGQGLRNTGFCSDKSPICMSVWTGPILPGAINVEAASPLLNISELMQTYLASAITLSSIEFQAFSNIPLVGTVAETRVRVHAKAGTIETLEADVQNDYAGAWSPLITPINLPLASGSQALFDTIWFKLLHSIVSTSQFEAVLAFGGTPIMNLAITTLAGTSDVTFRVRNAETGFDLPGADIIGRNGTNFAGKTGTGGTVTLTVYDGSYTVSARVLIGDTYFSGSTTLTAPVLGEVLIQVSPERFQLPWWWWLPIVGVGGLITLAVVIPRLKRRR